MSRFKFNTHEEVEMIKQFHVTGSLFAIESSLDLCAEVPPQNLKFFDTMRLLAGPLSDGSATFM